MCHSDCNAVDGLNAVTPKCGADCETNVACFSKSVVVVGVLR